MLPVQYTLTKEFPHIPHSHVDVVSGAAAAVAFIGELFMIKAMLVYDDRRNPGQQGRLEKVGGGRDAVRVTRSAAVLLLVVAVCWG